MLLLLLACTGPDTKTDDSTPDSATDTQPVVDSSPCPTETASMSGTVITLDGQPLEGARVNLCRTFCDSFETLADGRFEYVDFEAGPCTHAFDVVDVTGENMTPLSVVHAEDGENRTDVMVVMMPPEATLAIPPTAAEELDLCGVHVTMATSDLELPFGEDGDVASCSRPSPQLWMPWDDLPGEAIAVWYLAPFDAKGALPFWIENDLGLEDGTYQAWAADYDHQNWASAGTLTVAGDRIDSDGTLPLLSTLVITN
jgi:hypothetical protein